MEDKYTKRFVVELVEFERGWGQRVDELVYFDDLQDADEYVKNFNAANDSDEVPDWYMIARDPRPNENYQVTESKEKNTD